MVLALEGDSTITSCLPVTAVGEMPMPRSSRIRRGRLCRQILAAAAAALGGRPWRYHLPTRRGRRRLPWGGRGRFASVEHGSLWP